MITLNKQKEKKDLFLEFFNTQRQRDEVLAYLNSFTLNELAWFGSTHPDHQAHDYIYEYIQNKVTSDENVKVESEIIELPCLLEKQECIDLLPQYEIGEVKQKMGHAQIIEIKNIEHKKNVKLMIVYPAIERISIHVSTTIISPASQEEMMTIANVFKTHIDAKVEALIGDIFFETTIEEWGSWA